MSAQALFELDPREAAEVAAGQDPSWLEAFCDALDEHRRSAPLTRVLEVWGLSGADAARLFGVTRQAVSQWLDRGVPSERSASVADLAAITDLLLHHLKRDRIAAVVRRPADRLGGRSLLDLARSGDTAGALVACRAMFDFGATSA
jgi:hypothetical protein